MKIITFKYVVDSLYLVGCNASVDYTVSADSMYLLLIVI